MVVLVYSTIQSVFRFYDIYIYFYFFFQVGLIILYDHVHPVGAFAKTSNIDVSAYLTAT